MNSTLRLFVIALSALTFAYSVEAQDVTIDEWVVPWDDTRPRDPFVHSDGIVWFVGQRGDYAASFDPETRKFKRYDLGEGAGPHNLIVAADGMVWFAGNRQGYIGRLDPVTGDITKYPMPDQAARDPHTLVFDGKGDIWFTVQGGNFVGKFTMADKQTTLVAVPTQRARPYGIVIDENDHPWIVLFGSNKLATIDPESMELQEFELPRANARPRRIGITPDQNLWYVDYAGGFLGRFDPKTEEFREWPMPSGTSSRPYGMSVDADGRVWFVETGVQPNRFVGFDPVSESFFSTTEVESGGGTIRHMYFDVSANAIWFGADSNTIGKAKLGPKSGT